jgi:hypothetical protein
LCFFFFFFFEEIFELTILSKMKIISGYSVNSFHQIIFHGGDVFSKVCLESSKDIEVSRSSGSGGVVFHLFIMAINFPGVV